jgi:site-specific DNA-methyltransferase (adenine-specific)
MKKRKLMLGDNIESLKKLPDNSVDSVVTDPPYGLSFMNKKWDYDVPSIEFWKEVYRVLKPGGHVLSFGGTRTYHRMVVNIEDAGFEIRDQIQWIYGSGFPKSHNIGKAVDKLSGLEIPKNSMRVVNSVGIDNYNGTGSGRRYDSVEYKSKNEYEGWGTALKPANEPICVARKPLSEKSVAENVLKWGTGGINIDGCRVGSEIMKEQIRDNDGGIFMNKNKVVLPEHEGRFPANIILECICDDSISHDDPNCPCRLLDEQTGYLKSGEVKPHHKKNKTANGYQGSCYGKFQNEDTTLKGYGDGGGASRFFYQAKVSKAERNMGLVDKNGHPTLKPINLMAYLCRLITPTGGIVLDPFMGSGSTGISAQLEGFRFIGMEMDPEYFKIAEARIDSYEKYEKFKKL